MVKILDLSQLTPSDLSSLDFMPIVDVSDNTQSYSGTTKKILRGDIFWKPFATQKYIGVGGATGGGANGSGIIFPATADPSSDLNMLDDYEEGTFTPTWYGATTEGTTTYATNGQKGEYTKIGRLIFFSIFINITNSTGTGGVRIGGLPFNAWNNTTYGAINSFWSGFNVSLTTNHYMASMAIAGNNNFAVPYSSLISNANGIGLDMATDRNLQFAVNGFYVSESDAS